MNSEEVELRKKTLKLELNKAKKYYSGGGTPDLVSKLSVYPKQFKIESKGMPIHGTQARVDYARIRTKSQNTIDIVRKKEKDAGSFSLNNEVKKSQSIKKHADYEKLKTHLSLPFHSECRDSGMEAYSRLKKNGDFR